MTFHIQDISEGHLARIFYALLRPHGIDIVKPDLGKQSQIKGSAGRRLP